jgi:hypothetical protein
MQLGDYPYSTTSLEALKHINANEPGNVGPCVLRIMSHLKMHE